MARYEHSGNAQDAHLIGNLTSTGLGLTIDAASGWPTAATNKFWIAVDPDTASEEHILVNVRTGTALTVAAIGDRGLEGTTAVAHTTGAVVRHIFSATEATDMALQSVANTFAAAQTFSSTITVTGAATFHSSIGADGAVTALVGNAAQTAVGLIGTAGGGIQVGGGTPTNYMAVIAGNTWGIFTNTAQQVKIDDGGGPAGSSALSIRENATVQRVLVGAAGSGPGGAGKALYLA